MRITFPNPLGPPITMDTAPLGRLSEQLSNTPIAVWMGRKPHLKFLALIFLLLALLGWRPRPPLPHGWSTEWALEEEVGDSALRAKSDGGAVRVVKFDIPKESGLSHQLQRVVLQHHLAVLGNRSFAFSPISYDDTWLPFKVTRWPWRSAQVPLSAYVGSVVSGFEAALGHPKALPVSYYRSICSGRTQRTYTIRNEANPSGDLELDADGPGRITQLQVLLAGSDDACIEIKGDVFDDPFFDSPGPVQIFDSFVGSPLMKHFAFSPSVLSLLNNVMHELAPESFPYDLAKTGTQGRGAAWKHILAMHIRRGDGWESVCTEKGQRSAPFVAWNKLPKLPGNENVPPPPEMVEATRMGLYHAKCLPQTLEIIARARRLRKNHPLLKSVYILGDIDDSWMHDLRMWLESEGWEKVWLGERDVYPSWEDRELGGAVDMEIARRSGVFVGNGFSATSSNVVLLRSRDGVHPDLTQFW